jgi:hypothetical protein
LMKRVSSHRFPPFMNRHSSRRHAMGHEPLVSHYG